MNINYSEWNKEQMNLLNTYLNNEMKNLKKICHFVWGNKGISNCYHDDLYDDAMNVLCKSVQTFDYNKKTSFKTYLTNNIRNSYEQWFRDNFLRSKRNNLLIDKNGKIKKDENGKPIIIHNISLDAPEDSLAMLERVSISKTIEKENYFNTSDKVDRYLNNLSKDQQKVAKLIMSGYTNDEIKKILNMTQNEFSECINGMKSYKNRSLLF